MGILLFFEIHVKKQASVLYNAILTKITIYVNQLGGQRELKGPT